MITGQENTTSTVFSLLGFLLLFILAAAGANEDYSPAQLSAQLLYLKFLTARWYTDIFSSLELAWVITNFGKWMQCKTIFLFYRTKQQKKSG